MKKHHANNDFIEYEAKFYPIDKITYRIKLKKLGAKLISPERKLRRAIVDSSLYPQLLCHYIRVRDEGDSVRLSAKTHARSGGKITDQREIDITVSDYNKAINLIEAMGFKFTIYQETLRETWNFKNAEITIDTWPGLDSYTEIEANSEEDVKSLANSLELEWESRIITGIKEVYVKIYGLTMDEVSEKISYITFEKNPFLNIPKVKHL